MILLLVAVVYMILLDEIVMSLSQRRFGPFNIGILGLLASIVNGINLLLIQSYYVMSSYSFVMFVGPLVFLLLLLATFSLICPLYILDVSWAFLMLIVLSSVLALVYFTLSYSSFSKYSMVGAFRIFTQYLAFGLLFDVILAIVLYVYCFTAGSLFSLSVLI
jgi:NADH:ubiquinone oxidoreductase subunit H